MKTITILGATGSIGTQAQAVARAQGYRIHGLSAHSNWRALERAAREFSPRVVHIYEERLYRDLKLALADTGVTVTAGEAALSELAAADEADTVLNAVVGMVGLRPTLAALRAGREVALANKETLVAGGELVMRAARENGARILPVDSEHSAIFQSLQGCADSREVKKIILTASGGPFFGYTAEQLERVEKAEALCHPNWVMGQKITVDSATLMNKGLEFIEAVWLFGAAPRDIEIVVHRESVIHSLVEYADHSVIAQLGVPDMAIPIQYALTYPHRAPSSARRLSLVEYGRLTFFEPDFETFLCLKTAIDAIREGGLKPAIVNCANEEAVALFLQDKIRFADIGRLVRASLSLPGGSYAAAEEVYAAGERARRFVREQAQNI